MKLLTDFCYTDCIFRVPGSDFEDSRSLGAAGSPAGAGSEEFDFEIRYRSSLKIWSTTIFSWRDTLLIGCFGTAEQGRPIRSLSENDGKSEQS